MGHEGGKEGAGRSFLIHSKKEERTVQSVYWNKLRRPKRHCFGDHLMVKFQGQRGLPLTWPQTLCSHGTREAPAHWLMYPLQLGALQGGHTREHPCTPSCGFEKTHCIVGEGGKDRGVAKMDLPRGQITLGKVKLICQLKASVTSFILTGWWSKNKVTWLSSTFTNDRFKWERRY